LPEDAAAGGVLAGPLPDVCPIVAHASARMAQAIQPQKVILAFNVMKDLLVPIRL
jgi:hypothetical protein